MFLYSMYPFIELSIIMEYGNSKYISTDRITHYCHELVKKGLVERKISDKNYFSDEKFQFRRLTPSEIVRKRNER